MSSKPQQHDSFKSNENHILHDFIAQEGGKFFPRFKLFHQQNITDIDLLLFLPNFGIFIGETVDWHASELKNATVERSSRRAKRPAATHFESVESKVRRKLEDVLSFDSTPIHRFIWMKNLTEAEFDALDPSFHEQLPKFHLLFSDETLDTVKSKIYTLAHYRQDPYSALKIVGALNSHTVILPTPINPSGALPSPRQNLFLTSEQERITTLIGGYGSGKSTLLIRQALIHLLSHPYDKVMIITPTLLGGELLRDELVSLLEYGALSIDLSALSFYSPLLSETSGNTKIEHLKSFQEASVILCDDAHLFETEFLEKLESQCGKRRLLLTSALPHESGTLFELSGRFRRSPTPKTIVSKRDRLIVTLLVHLRKILKYADFIDLMIIVSDDYQAALFKEAVDEYFGQNCRILLPSFSLQYQDLDSLIITTPKCSAPLSRGHVILAGIGPSYQNYSLALSRASESLTIITFENTTHEDSPDENPEN